MTVLDRLAALVVQRECRRVGIDGVDGSGKTTMADALAARLPPPVARVSVDHFLRPPAERYRLGRRSPEGCYRDTFDHDAVRAAVAAAGRTVVVVDGVFLQRPELAVGWDLVLHLQVPDEEALRRVVARDGTEPALVRERYLAAQRLYEDEVGPAERAHVVVDNRDPQAPVVLRWP